MGFNLFGALTSKNSVHSATKREEDDDHEGHHHRRHDKHNSHHHSKGPLAVHGHPTIEHHRIRNHDDQKRSLLKLHKMHKKSVVEREEFFKKHRDQKNHKVRHGKVPHVAVRHAHDRRHRVKSHDQTDTLNHIKEIASNNHSLNQEQAPRSVMGLYDLNTEKADIFNAGDPVMEDPQHYPISKTYRPRRWDEHNVLSNQFPNRGRTDFEINGNKSFYRGIDRNLMVSETDNTAEQRNDIRFAFKKIDSRQPFSLRPVTHNSGVTFGQNSLR
jgi:hypothetical protein